MEKTKYRRLQELDRSNFEIVKGEPDIRGWDVRYRNGQKIGSVEELILDAKAKKVRYMVVDLDENELRLEERKLLIPIGFAELDNKSDDVLIPNVSVDQLCSLPDYNKNSLNPDVERKISSTFGRKSIEPIAPAKKSQREVSEVEYEDDIDPDFYKHDYYNTDNLYRNRLSDAKLRKADEVETDRALRLGEKTREGEIIDTSDLTDEEREKLLRYRRELYRERRYKKESV